LQFHIFSRDGGDCLLECSKFSQLIVLVLLSHRLSLEWTYPSKCNLVFSAWSEATHFDSRAVEGQNGACCDADAISAVIADVQKRKRQRRKRQKINRQRRKRQRRKRQRRKRQRRKRQRRKRQKINRQRRKKQRRKGRGGKGVIVKFTIRNWTKSSLLLAKQSLVDAMLPLPPFSVGGAVEDLFCHHWTLNTLKKNKKNCGLGLTPAVSFVRER
jgi:hypothetical protein